MAKNTGKVRGFFQSRKVGTLTLSSFLKKKKHIAFIFGSLILLFVRL